MAEGQDSVRSVIAVFEECGQSYILLALVDPDAAKPDEDLNIARAERSHQAQKGSHPLCHLGHVRANGQVVQPPRVKVAEGCAHRVEGLGEDERRLRLFRQVVCRARTSGCETRAIRRDRQLGLERPICRLDHDAHHAEQDVGDGGMVVRNDGPSREHGQRGRPVAYREERLDEEDLLLDMHDGHGLDGRFVGLAASCPGGRIVVCKHARSGQRIARQPDDFGLRLRLELAREHVHGLFVRSELRLCSW